MGDLYEWIILAKQKNPEAAMRILKQFEPKLRQSLYRTTFQERDDLKQELHIKLLNAMGQFEVDDIPGFFEYIIHNEKLNKHLKRK